jgi:hypothetical protein
MFDDAEVTSKLDGWDLNRWARHLAGKLLGSETLPPMPEGAPAIGEVHDAASDGMLLQPGLPPTPAELMDDAKLEDYTSESPELADWVPTSPSLASKDDAADAAAESFSWDGSQSEGDGEAREFKLDTDLGIDVDLASLDFAPAPEPAPVAMETSLDDEPIFQDTPVEAMRFSSFTDAPEAEHAGDLDADVAALAAQLEAFEKNDTRAAPSEPDFARAAQKETTVMPVIEAPSVMPKGAKPSAKPAPAAAPGAAGRWRWRFRFQQSLLGARGRRGGTGQGAADRGQVQQTRGAGEGESFRLRRAVARRRGSGDTCGRGRRRWRRAHPGRAGRPRCGAPVAVHAAEPALGARAALPAPGSRQARAPGRAAGQDQQAAGAARA